MKKILVVDNDIDALNVVKVVLTDHHFIVKTISRWQIVSKTVKTFMPDLILLDIDLEGKDGSEICKDLKDKEETKHLPVILFSGHRMPEEYLKACDAQGFLAKPFGPAGLLKIISENLN